MRRSFLVAFIGIILIACQKEGIEPKYEEQFIPAFSPEVNHIVAGLNNQGLAIFKDLAKDSQADTLFSPLLFGATAGMALNATGERVSYSIKREVNCSEVESILYNKSFNQLLNGLGQSGAKVANAMWIDKENTLERAKQDMIMAYYEAWAEVIDLQNGDNTRNSVNRWTKGETNIDALFTSQDFSNSSLSFVSTLNLAVDDDFVVNEPKIIFQNRNGQFDLPGVELQAANGKYLFADSMTMADFALKSQGGLRLLCVMPENRANFNGQINHDNILSLINASKSAYRLSVTLPAININSTSVVTPHLGEGGIVDEVNCQLAHGVSFSLKSSGLLSKQAQQAASISVTFDKPFYFFAYDQFSGGILLCGKISHPQKHL